MKHTVEELIEAYKETGSVWKAGKKLGIPGQSVHSRLSALGYK
jgi:molybdenum-dependent DNA-binding transcriptional regulator ModE